MLCHVNYTVYVTKLNFLFRHPGESKAHDLRNQELCNVTHADCKDSDQTFSPSDRPVFTNSLLILQIEQNESAFD